VHTAFQLRESHFRVDVGDGPGTYRDLFPGWNSRDRVGLIVDSPIGGIGASLIVQLSVVAHFAHDPARIGRNYPDLFVFHIGDFHGSHSPFDAFPPRKEVVLPNDPALILEAINDRGISRLLVVDGPAEPVRHHLREPEAAQESIKNVFAYSPRGQVAEADVSVTGLADSVKENPAIIVDPDGTADLLRRLVARLHANTTRPDGQLYVAPRADGPSSDVRAAVGARRIATVGSDSPRETYRRVPLADALGMLHCRL
jgi:hypothetical protein